MQITLDKAKELKRVVEKGLCYGIGNSKPGKMCVEAAVSYVLYGDGSSDRPACTHPIIASLKITLNDDGGWSSNKTRAKGLLRTALAQLGSNKIDLPKFKEKLAELMDENFAPLFNIKAHEDGYDAKSGRGLADELFCGEVPDYLDDYLASLLAEQVVQALKFCKTPGSKWLYLAPLKLTPNKEDKRLIEKAEQLKAFKKKFEVTGSYLRNKKTNQAEEFAGDIMDAFAMYNLLK